MPHEPAKRRHPGHGLRPAKELAVVPAGIRLPITGCLPLSRLADALQLIADKATLRTLLLPGEGVSA